MTQLNLPQSSQHKIQEFEFNTNQIRVVDKDGELWFLAPDVCSVLGLSNPTMALRRLDDDEYALNSIEGITKGNDQVNLINESGLYSLTLGSRKPVAKEFKRWVTHEVLPTIRKTGSYSMQPQFDTLSTVKDRKNLTNLLNALVSIAPVSYRDARHMLYAHIGVEHADEIRLSQIQPSIDFVQSKIDLYCATPEVDFITRQALAGVKAFTARLTVEEVVSKTAKVVHREFKANIYITEEKPKHEIAAYLDTMLDSHQKRINRAGIR